MKGFGVKREAGIGEKPLYCSPVVFRTCCSVYYMKKRYKRRKKHPCPLKKMETAGCWWPSHTLWGFDKSLDFDERLGYCLDC